MGTYLALGGGPPEFRPDFSCPALLGESTGRDWSFVYGAITLFGRSFQIVPLDRPL
jgi:hypothetical protein